MKIINKCSFCIISLFLIISILHSTEPKQVTIFRPTLPYIPPVKILPSPISIFSSPIQQVIHPPSLRNVPCLIKEGYLNFLKPCSTNDCPIPSYIPVKISLGLNSFKVFSNGNMMMMLKINLSEIEAVQSLDANNKCFNIFDSYSHIYEFCGSHHMVSDDWIRDIMKFKIDCNGGSYAVNESSLENEKNQQLSESNPEKDIFGDTKFKSDSVNTYSEANKNYSEKHNVNTDISFSKSNLYNNSTALHENDNKIFKDFVQQATSLLSKLNDAEDKRIDRNFNKTNSFTSQEKHDKNTKIVDTEKNKHNENINYDEGDKHLKRKKIVESKEISNADDEDEEPKYIKNQKHKKTQIKDNDEEEGRQIRNHDIYYDNDFNRDRNTNFKSYLKNNQQNSDFNSYPNNQYFSNEFNNRNEITRGNGIQPEYNPLCNSPNCQASKMPQPCACPTCCEKPEVNKSAENDDFDKKIFKIFKKQENHSKKLLKALKALEECKEDKEKKEQKDLKEKSSTKTGGNTNDESQSINHNSIDTIEKKINEAIDKKISQLNKEKEVPNTKELQTQNTANPVNHSSYTQNYPGGLGQENNSNIPSNQSSNQSRRISNQTNENKADNNLPSNNNSPTQNDKNSIHHTNKSSSMSSGQPLKSHHDLKNSNSDNKKSADGNNQSMPVKQENLSNIDKDSSSVKGPYRINGSSEGQPNENNKGEESSKIVQNIETEEVKYENEGNDKIQKDDASSNPTQQDSDVNSQNNNQSQANPNTGDSTTTNNANGNSQNNKSDQNQPNDASSNPTQQDSDVNSQNNNQSQANPNTGDSTTTNNSNGNSQNNKSNQNQPNNQNNPKQNSPNNNFQNNPENKNNSNKPNSIGSKNGAQTSTNKNSNIKTPQKTNNSKPKPSQAIPKKGNSPLASSGTKPDQNMLKTTVEYSENINKTKPNCNDKKKLLEVNISKSQNYDYKKLAEITDINRLEICFTKEKEKILQYWKTSLRRPNFRHYVLSSSTFCYLCCRNEAGDTSLASRCCQERCDVQMKNIIHISVKCVNFNNQLNEKGVKVPRHDYVRPGGNSVTIISPFKNAIYYS
jgi:hypothetical protein